MGIKSVIWVTEKCDEVHGIRLDLYGHGLPKQSYLGSFCSLEPRSWPHFR